jgi:ATP-dependent DNA helicase RecQ
VVRGPFRTVPARENANAVARPPSSICRGVRLNGLVATPVASRRDSPLAADAMQLLRQLAGPKVDFRLHQLEAIEDLVVGRRRVLGVQRTGWGKSAVYFIATALLRRAGQGPTVLISPLLALMRNQIDAAARLDIAAETINSTNRDDWAAVAERLAHDDVDLLLISPERLNNPEFRREMLPLFVERVGLLVIDEAHCVSDWGHDFRPDYRRIRDVLANLRVGVPVLCTTATANDRVVADLAEQLAVGETGELLPYRGPLARESLRLETVTLPSQAERLAWLARWLPEFEGSGIVYTLTKRDTTALADWLNARGISAVAYSGDTPDEERLDVERRLLANEVKAVVATQALGMGYDKPDLGFAVHYQAPGSIIAYYQQVGRAGRALDEAQVVLLRGVEDRNIQDYFITTAFPPREIAEAIVEAVASSDRPARISDLLPVVNIGRGRIDALLKILDVEGAVRREGTGWLRTDQPWTYDEERYAQVTALRRSEQSEMARYGANGECLMRVLQRGLDDPHSDDCGRCSSCTGPRFTEAPARELVVLAEEHLRRRPLDLTRRKQWPPTLAGGARKIPDELRLASGRALARAGDGGWDPLIGLDVDHYRRATTPGGLRPDPWLGACARRRVTQLAPARPF